MALPVVKVSDALRTNAQSVVPSMKCGRFVMLEYHTPLAFTGAEDGLSRNAAVPCTSIV